MPTRWRFRIGIDMTTQGIHSAILMVCTVFFFFDISCFPILWCDIVFHDDHSWLFILVLVVILNFHFFFFLCGLCLRWNTWETRVRWSRAEPRKVHWLSWSIRTACLECYLQGELLQVCVSSWFFFFSKTKHSSKSLFEQASYALPLKFSIVYVFLSPRPQSSSKTPFIPAKQLNG